MICFPNAKINLGLHITGKLPDGYHTIETIFYPIPLTDALEVVPSKSLSFAQTGLPIDTLTTTPKAASNDNLVLKAYLLLSKTHTLPPLDIYLRKAIPIGAGLGGGSSDAAFMLQLLNNLCDCRLSDSQLETMAVLLGADCPFFIRNTPILATGIGNIFRPINLSLKGYEICVAKPAVAVSTREAYSNVRPQQASFSLDELSSTPVCEWRNVLVNQFEASIFVHYPVIGAIKSKLYALGAEYAAMSGSGSAVFGLFKTGMLPNNAVRESFSDCFVWTGTLH